MGGVGDQVDEDLRQLDRVGQDRRQVVVQRQLQPDAALGQQRGGGILGDAQDVGQLQRRKLQRLLARHRQE